MGDLSGVPDKVKWFHFWANYLRLNFPEDSKTSFSDLRHSRVRNSTYSARIRLVAEGPGDDAYIDKPVVLAGL